MDPKEEKLKETHIKQMKKASNLAAWAARTDPNEPGEDLIADVGGRDWKVRWIGLLKEDRRQDADNDLLLLIHLGQGVVEGVQIGGSKQSRRLQGRAAELNSRPEPGQVVVPD